MSADKAHVARMFAVIENRRAEVFEGAFAFLDGQYRTSVGQGLVLGLTGAPGSGKSSLISRLIPAIRQTGRTLAILAIDPSSRTSRGAILGDRIRFVYDESDAGVFVRSMANRAEYGGVSDRTFPAIVHLRAAYDVVIVETVGVGQAECDIAYMSDTVTLVIQPGAGDFIQFIKAGIMEMPHLFVVSKADMPHAQQTLNELQSMLPQISMSSEGWQAEALGCSAYSGEGIADFVQACDLHRETLGTEGTLEARRHRHAATWVWNTLRTRYGTRGLEEIPGGIEGLSRTIAEVTASRGPFESLLSLSTLLER